MPRACVFVLNRRGLDNLVVELCRASECEVTDELITFNVESTGSTSGADTGVGPASEEDTRVIGLWIHADQDDTREVNAAIIQNVWRQSRLSATLSEAEDREEQAGVTGDTGRRLSITELFGQRNGTLNR